MTIDRNDGKELTFEGIGMSNEAALRDWKQRGRNRAQLDPDLPIEHRDEGLSSYALARLERAKDL